MNTQYIKLATVERVPKWIGRPADDPASASVINNFKDGTQDDFELYQLHIFVTLLQLLLCHHL